MKLLLCGYKEIYQGGAEVYWTNIIASLSKRGINLRTVYLAKQNNNSFFKKGVTGLQFDELLREIDAFKPDLLHFNKQLILSKQQKKALKKRQVPIVLTVHDEYSVPFPTNIKQRIKQQFYRLEDIIDHFIIPSKHYYQLLAKNKQPNIYYIPHFINLKNWRYNPVINTKKQLLFVGRLEREKGVFLLLNTLAALVKEDADYQLTMVGEGKERQKIDQQINSLDIVNNVRVIGFKTGKALSNYYQQATLLIVPSLKKELFGLVGIEAQASGLPVIASDLAGMQEWCIHHQTGMTFKAKHGKQLQQQIQKVIADTRLQEKLIRNAYQFVINNFSQEKAMNQLLDLYKTIIL